MADFGIEIKGDYDGSISLHTWFNDENQLDGDVYTENIINIARELRETIKKLLALFPHNQQDIHNRQDITCVGEPSAFAKAWMKIHHP